MIKINLTPEEELQNPLWYVPDLIVVVVICVSGYFSSQYLLGLVEEDKKLLQSEVITIESRTAELDQDVKAYDAEFASLEMIESKLAGVGDISSSKVEKYQPIIAVEHLQNLKPAGVWFDGFRFKGLDKSTSTGSNTKGGQIHITGHAMDNLIVAEFITALRATQTQDADPSDYRTLVYFNKIDLQWTDLGLKPIGDVKNQEIVSFDLILEYKSRPLLKPEVLMGVSNKLSLSKSNSTAGL